MDINDAGAIEVVNNKIMLKNLDGKEQNIHPQVIGIDIHESVFQHTISAQIHLFDGVELLNLFPIRGEEIITFTIRTPGKDSITYEFYVDSIIDLQRKAEDDGRYYTIICSTKDFMMNNIKGFSKRYIDETSAVVNDILLNRLGTGKDLNIQSTKGIVDRLFMNKRPFQCIDLLVERAVPKEDKYYSSFFVFYEDNKKYNFTTIEKLFEQGPIDSYSYNIANQVKVEDVNFNNILAFNLSSIGQNRQKLQSGVIRSETRYIDLFTGQTYGPTNNDKSSGVSILKRDLLYIDKEEYGSFIKADTSFRNFNTDTFLDTFDDAVLPKRYYTMIDGSKEPDLHEETIGRRRAYRHKMEEHYVDLRVYGRTDITVGNIIKLDIPYMSGTTQTRQKGPAYKGNYLITQLKHEIRVADQEGPAHFLRLRVAKPNLTADY